MPGCAPPESTAAPAIGIVKLWRTPPGKWNTLLLGGELMVVSGGAPVEETMNRIVEMAAERRPAASTASACTVKAPPVVGGVNAAVQPVAAAPGEASTASCVVMICCHLRVAAFHHWLPESRLIATTTRATPVSSEALPDTVSGPPGLGMVDPSAGPVTMA